MKELIKLFAELLPLILALCGTFSSIIFGLSKRKKSKSLTIEVQRNDLRAFMIKKCENVERFTNTFNHTSADKSSVATYKLDTVLNDCLVYAKACGYEWVDKYELGRDIEEYVYSANITSGKKQ